jgi:Cys-tRNA(Pro)/Cys-tRNA(Cys) deacylase
VYPVFVGRSALAHEIISVSAGERGVQVLLGPGAYVQAGRATVAELTRGE